MRVGIVGAGLMGMALGQRLSADGHEVTVLERDSQVGGLATHHDFGGFFRDRFYHVILPTDRHLIGYLDDIGLGADLQWRQTRTGFYVDERMHSISNALEFLRFPLLPLHAKLRLAWTMVYGSRIDDWKSRERVTVADWLVRVGGRAAYEKLWRPLLLAKLGPSFERVSAVFIWAYIKRLFSARDGAASKEQLGHLRGGYKSVFERIEALIGGAGGRVVMTTLIGIAVDQGKLSLDDSMLSFFPDRTIANRDALKERITVLNPHHEIYKRELTVLLCEDCYSRFLLNR